MRTTKLLKITLIAIFSCMALWAVAQENKITDENITEKVETEMAWQLYLPADQIDVETKEGIVLLSGTVNNIQAKERAVNLTGAVRGVRGVVDQIKVDPPEIDDSMLKDKILEALLNDPAADSYEVNVAVSDGMVTLTGTVDSWQEKNLSGYVAKGVKGVKSLENKIVVDYKMERPDYEIKRDIEQSLRTDIRIFPNTVDVQVDDGKVTLTGSVGSVNAKDLVRNYAWTIGVFNVDMTGLKVESWADNSNLRNQTTPNMTDQDIREAVKDAFLYDPRVFSFNPEVKVINGVVTLSGYVDNLKAKRAAAADARNVVGVEMVKNNLKVRPVLIPDNSVLESRVYHALMLNPDVEQYEIVVAAYNGKVYLNGAVDTYFEQSKAEEIASGVKGVVDVINNLSVYYFDDNDFVYPYATGSMYYPLPYSSPGLYYDYPLTDQQIAENIENELWWSPYVQEDAIQVEVVRGVATLSGTVDTWQEKQTAIENAYEGGAISVVDKLHIDYHITN